MSAVLEPALHEALKALKLTGMLATLDERAAQARGGQLGHLEFLQVLCEDELARRQTAALTRRLARARFEAANTFEGFDFQANPRLPGPRTPPTPPNNAPPSTKRSRATTVHWATTPTTNGPPAPGNTAAASASP